MKKDVIIKIVGSQEIERDADVIELVTEGHLYDRAEKYYLTYKETEMTGFEGTTTTLKVEPSRVTMMRRGRTRSELIFEKGQRHLTHYDTGFAVFNVGISTSELNSSLSMSGGEVKIDYNIEINNLHASANRFEISVKEVRA